MPYPFKRILCPIDFDDSSMSALDLAAAIAKPSQGIISVLHVVPMIMPPTGMPVYVDLYKGQEALARTKLAEIAKERLAGIKCELLARTGTPAEAILTAAKDSDADLIVMATHGRRGFSRFFLGSVAEMILREAGCPVLTVRTGHQDKHQVATWMTRNPVTASPDEKLDSIQKKMSQGNFRCVPIVKDGVPIGILTDRDIRQRIGLLDKTEAQKAIAEPLITVTPTTTVSEAARLLREHKIGALPVVEDGKLTGVITTSDVLAALTAEAGSVET